jgi:uncharacterized membrane protein YfcA
MISKVVDRVLATFVALFAVLMLLGGWLAAGVPTDPMNWFVCVGMHLLAALMLFGSVVLWRLEP